MIIKDQNLVAETLNSYFTNVVEGLDIQPHNAFENELHVSDIPRNWNCYIIPSALLGPSMLWGVYNKHGIHLVWLDFVCF